jgi:hypothetical protein
VKKKLILEIYAKNLGLYKIIEEWKWIRNLEFASIFQNLKFSSPKINKKYKFKLPWYFLNLNPKNLFFEILEFRISKNTCSKKQFYKIFLHLTNLKRVSFFNKPKFYSAKFVLLEILAFLNLKNSSKTHFIQSFKF